MHAQNNWPLNPLPLYSLFEDWNKNASLVKLGLEDYFLLMKWMRQKQLPPASFDEFVAACETLWLKHHNQCEAFRDFFEKRRQDIDRLIAQLKVQPDEGAVKPAIETDEKNPNLSIAPGALDLSSQTDKGNASDGSDITGKENPLKKKKGEAPPPEPTEETGSINIAVDGEVDSGLGQGHKIVVQDSSENLTGKKKFLLETQYFPVLNRELQQRWRALYSNQATERRGDIDIVGTVHKISRSGMFTDFEYEAAEANLLSLFVFIDQGGSMVAYEEFGKALVQTAAASEVHVRTKPYFFYNVPLPLVPREDVYTVYNEKRTRAFYTSKLFKDISRKNTVLLLYSDAGAFKEKEEFKERKDFPTEDSPRVKATTAFLQSMLRHTAFTAWLNPVPEHRWLGTAADVIRQKVPEVGMFEANRTGITQAINALKGKITQPIKKQHAASS